MSFSPKGKKKCKPVKETKTKGLMPSRERRNFLTFKRKERIHIFPPIIHKKSEFIHRVVFSKTHVSISCTAREITNSNHMPLKCGIPRFLHMVHPPILPVTLKTVMNMQSVTSTNVTYGRKLYLPGRPHHPFKILIYFLHISHQITTDNMTESWY